MVVATYSNISCSACLLISLPFKSEEGSLKSNKTWHCANFLRNNSVLFAGATSLNDGNFSNVTLPYTWNLDDFCRRGTFPIGIVSLDAPLSHAIALFVGCFGTATPLSFEFCWFLDWDVELLLRLDENGCFWVVDGTAAADDDDDDDDDDNDDDNDDADADAAFAAVDDYIYISKTYVSFYNFLIFTLIYKPWQWNQLK